MDSAPRPHPAHPSPCQSSLARHGDQPRSPATRPLPVPPHVGSQCLTTVLWQATTHAYTLQRRRLGRNHVPGVTQLVIGESGFECRLESRSGASILGMRLCSPSTCRSVHTTRLLNHSRAPRWTWNSTRGALACLVTAVPLGPHPGTREAPTTWAEQMNA